MHGPYSARVAIRDQGSISLYQGDVVEGGRIADRFYNSGQGLGLLSGFTRAAVFATGLLLDAGDEADVEIVGYRGSGRDERETVVRTESVRRDARGRLVSTLGSRFNERIFAGV